MVSFVNLSHFMLTAATKNSIIRLPFSIKLSISVKYEPWRYLLVPGKIPDIGSTNLHCLMMIFFRKKITYLLIVKIVSVDLIQSELQWNSTLVVLSLFDSKAPYC